MKAEIKRNRLILTPETKGEVKKLEKYLKSNDAMLAIPKSRKRIAYWKILDVSLLIDM